MKISEFISARLKSQNISVNDFTKVSELVSTMGAIQAQDFEMLKWAVGLRVKNCAIKDFEDAFDKGDILRTHLMRPTWHLVSSDDIYWIMKLTADKIRTAAIYRDKQIGIESKTVVKGKQILKDVLKENHLNTDELREIFTKEKIRIVENHLYHYLMHAELDCLICSGKIINGKKTYALFDERVKVKKEYSREEALKKLAEKYFAARSPATAEDFTWWSGLKTSEANKSIEMNKSSLQSFEFNGKTYWSMGDNLPLSKKNSDLVLLPSYDEYIISYADRSAVLIPDHNRKAISSNGIFRPVIIRDGIVVGLWKKTLKKDKIVITPDLFVKSSKTLLNELHKGAEQYGKFYGKEVQLMNV